MKHFGRDGVVFALGAMLAQVLYFGAVDFPPMTPGERVVDATIGSCLFVALAIWALQNATRH